MDTQVLPLAITMMAGPQIMSAIIFLTNKTPVKVSLAFISAVALAVTLGVFLVTVLAHLLGQNFSLGSDSGGSASGQAIELILVALLIFLAVKSYLGRQTSEPPQWMGTLQAADVGKAFTTGLLLIFLMPSDVLIMLTTGVHLVDSGHNLAAAVPFIAATVLIASLPLLAYLLFRKRAATAMPKVRRWMNSHSWAVNIFVYLLFVFLIVS